MRRILALVLSVAMVLILPVFAFADGFYNSQGVWVSTGDEVSSTEVTDSNGTTTKTTTTADGTTETVVTTADGEQTVDVELSAAAAAKEEAYVTPEVTATEDVATAPKVTVELPTGADSALVEIAVANNSTKVTVMKQNADGTWSVVKKAAAGEDGVVVNVEDGATYAVVEKALDFTDITSSWEKKAADFVSSRELMLGTGVDTFNPKGDITADMMMTVLARLDNEADITAETTGPNWAAAGEAWAAKEGYAVSGTFTRADMAKLLYKYAGSPAAKTEVLDKFVDVEGLDADTIAALAWCNENKILEGTSADKMSPNGTATRGMLAKVMMTFVGTIVK